MDIIENLQEHENVEVYQKALNIIETFFGEGDEAEETEAPVAGHFAGGLMAAPQAAFSF